MDDELRTILREIIVHCESDDFPDDLSKCILLALLVLLHEHYDPSIWLHICVILGQICNKFRLASLGLSTPVTMKVRSCMAFCLSVHRWVEQQCAECRAIRSYVTIFV